MKRFLVKLTFLVILVVGSVYLVLTRADGYTDPFYVRFTTPKQKNLIIGTSRAAQGLQPDIFQDVMKKAFFNYSFTIYHSPFGPTYLESIKKKLDTENKDGVFIVVVDPWSISSRRSDPNDTSKFRELSGCLHKTKVVSMNPNPFYLLQNLNGKYYKLLMNINKRMFLHDNGWLEVTVGMDSASIERRIEGKIKIYREKNLPIYKFSSTRLDYLHKTIQYLNAYGKVYIVRLPIDPRMMEIENLLMPDFDSKLKEAKSIASGYLDLTNNNSDFVYTDGNHLYKESGKVVSRITANWIYNHEKSRINAQPSSSQNGAPR